MESRIAFLVDGNPVRRIVDGKRSINSIFLQTEACPSGHLLFCRILGSYYALGNRRLMAGCNVYLRRFCQDCPLSYMPRFQSERSPKG
ncbi:hypothetical protein C048_02350 [Brucella melitensis UK19/04]|nr:hypothetical protein C048_02350 [Brucella melitensis UK19/04]ENS67715.1 hypothetical protein C034_03200 [Brucella melitensis UK14/06]ENS70667.1 hypothetical protein C060_02821 [Brucella melitensis UK22/04]ENS73130.1 hypothetical protein C059_02339 [Brucella melitensis UK23/06]ENS77872.1 hypothetical protein C047_02346 [Brucella melitensis Uk24/06]